ncbi:hypothetical protein BDV28DRAFT_133399 [Aspergillus coremiiformis]|uniref:Uncharacterized protein n=1 Tax=Aspergillus coremiiformis TaxID=138285 RepID=A0A5N6Z7C1_9EURO|nr:hypothetical protein BDV28DRAFT_133399 [Aspergillus coremiiformis]
MQTSTLLLVLSALGVHAVPFFHPRADDLSGHRDVQYSVVNVGGTPSNEVTPVVETITAISPPQPPVTITITHSPSLSPSSTPSPLPWSVGPLPSDIPSGDSPVVPRGLNATSRRFLRRASSANSTEAHPFVARHNGTEFHLDARSNSTASLIARSNSTESKLLARGNGTASGLGARSNIVNSRLAGRTNDTASALIARGNSTESHISAGGVKITDRAALYLRDALNSTSTHDSNAVARRGATSTSLQA